jgi:hypothetical protein
MWPHLARHSIPPSFVGSPPPHHSQLSPSDLSHTVTTATHNTPLHKQPLPLHVYLLHGLGYRFIRGCAVYEPAISIQTTSMFLQCSPLCGHVLFSLMFVCTRNSGLLARLQRLPALPKVPPCSGEPAAPVPVQVRQAGGERHAGRPPVAHSEATSSTRDPGGVPSLDGSPHVRQPAGGSVSATAACVRPP